MKPIRFMPSVLWIALTAVSWQAWAETTATLVPIAIDLRDDAAKSTYLRGRHRLHLYAENAGQKIGVTITSRQIGRYTDQVTATAANAGSAEPLALGPGETGTLSFAAATRGQHEVEINTRRNAACVLPLSGPLCVAASPTQRLHCISSVHRVYFFVPPEARHFDVWTRGSGKEENVRLHVYGPDMQKKAECTVVGGNKGRAAVDVPAELAGRVWFFTADKPPQLPGTFEDAEFWLSPDVAQVAALARTSIMVPFCQGLVQRPRVRSPGGDTIELALAAPAPAAATFEAQVRSADGNTQILAARAPASERKLRLALPPSTPIGEYVLHAAVRAPNGQELARAESAVSVTDSVLFVGGYQRLLEATITPLGPDETVPRLALRRNLVAHTAAGFDVSVALRRTENWEPPSSLKAKSVWTTSVQTLSDETRYVTPPSGLKDGHYQWLAVAQADGKRIDWQQAHFLLKQGQCFEEVPPPPAAPLLAAQGSARGVVAFVPDDVDAIPYNYRPSRADLARPLALAATPGEYEPATLGLIGLRDYADVRLRVTDAKLGDATIASAAFDVRVARYWPQRTSWRTTRYRVIPEMLETRDSFGLAAFELKQVWVTVQVPADAKAGLYRGTLVASAGQARVEVPVQLEVYPFRLARPQDVNWGLYSDSSRWRRMPSSQVQAELRDFAGHGITSLMIYPLSHSEVKYEDGRLSIDSSQFEAYMNLAMKCGLRPPTVMSMQGLNGTVRRLVKKPLEDPEFKRVYQAITRHYVDLGKANGWGECVWHAVDEPRVGNQERMRRTALELSYFKELGLLTFTTAGLVSPQLDQVLDVRCYPPAHLLLSAEMAAEQRRATLSAGDRLWYYGSGCYTGQDGNVIRNRILAGYTFYKSKATGEWSWTFMRAKDNIYDDFDGAKHGECKEACICYPSTTQGAATPTLQWEGIREGVDDYCYLHTLAQAAKRKGLRVDHEIEEMLVGVPWIGQAQTFTARDAQAIRGRVARQLVEILGQQRR